MEFAKKNSGVKDIARFINSLIKLIAVLCGAYLGNEYILHFSNINANTNQNSNANTNQNSNASTNQSSNQSFLYLQSSTTINSEKSMISREFVDSIQACWYYHAHYKNLYPYTVMWNESSIESEYPKIRVIADEASWVGQDCIKEDKYDDENNLISHMKLIGAETIHHRIEAQLNETSDFKHIADAKANYRSELIFDNSGRIIERKVKEDEYKCAMDSSFKEHGISSPDDCNDKSKQDGGSWKIGNPDSNSVVIKPIKIQEYKGEDNYVKALELYIKGTSKNN